MSLSWSKPMLEGRHCNLCHQLDLYVRWDREHGPVSWRPSSDDSFHSPTVIPPSALDKPSSIVKRYHRRRTCSHTSPRRSPTMVTFHDTRFVECRWWIDGWTENWRSSASMIQAQSPVVQWAKWTHGNLQNTRCFGVTGGRELGVLASHRSGFTCN